MTPSDVMLAGFEGLAGLGSLAFGLAVALVGRMLRDAL